MNEATEKKIIESLTPEQEAQLDVYYNKWLKIGLQTGTNPDDREKAEACIKQAYRNQNLKEPEIIWARSPHEAAKICVEKGDSGSGLVWNAGYGHHDAPWLGFYDFMREVLGLRDETEEIVPLIELAKVSGWWFPYENICVASDRPEEIHTNDEGILHRFDGPAIRYADGFELYMFNGVEVTEQHAKTPADQIPVEMITKESNADVRREIVRKIGKERLYNLIKPEELDKFEEYVSLSFDIGDGRTRPHLKMVCPSTGALHIPGVPPETKTVLEALAFHFKQAEWKRPIKEDGFVRGGDPADYKDGQTLYRHGDVHLKKYSGPVPERKGEPLTRGVLVRGTNNSHDYASGLFYIHELDGVRLVEVIEESTIDHREHGAQSHPPGVYLVDIAQEYDHWKEEARAVAD